LVEFRRVAHLHASLDTAHDRGRLVVGARGDITLCHLDGANPRVIGSFRTGQGANRGLALQDA
jgi:hypothetical protein